VQRFAQRLGYLRRADGALGQRGREDWERGPPWQPLRRCLEELLTTYDFTEAFVGLQEAVKPALDALVLQSFAAAAERQGDGVTACALASLQQDAAWHREWSRALLDLAAGSEPAAGAVAELRRRWSARAGEAVAPLLPRLGGTAG
jgi:toluene monooxygenase system protein E